MPLARAPCPSPRAQLRARRRTRVSGLTFFETNRPPILPLDTDQEVTITMRTLNDEFKCPVCLGILQDTLTIMEVRRARDNRRAGWLGTACTDV